MTLLADERHQIFILLRSFVVIATKLGFFSCLYGKLHNCKGVYDVHGQYLGRCALLLGSGAIHKGPGVGV